MILDAIDDNDPAIYKQLIASGPLTGSVVRLLASQVFSVRGNDIAPAGVPFWITSVTQPQHGSVAIVYGSGGTYGMQVQYIPNPVTSFDPTWTGAETDSFSYTIADANNDPQDTATVTITGLNLTYTPGPLPEVEFLQITEDTGISATDKITRSDTMQFSINVTGGPGAGAPGQLPVLDYDIQFDFGMDGTVEFTKAPQWGIFDLSTEVGNSFPTTNGTHHIKIQARTHRDAANGNPEENGTWFPYEFDYVIGNRAPIGDGEEYYVEFGDSIQLNTTNEVGKAGILSNDSDPDGDNFTVQVLGNPPLFGTLSVNASTGAMFYHANPGITESIEYLEYRVADEFGATSNYQAIIYIVEVLPSIISFDSATPTTHVTVDGQVASVLGLFTDSVDDETVFVTVTWGDGTQDSFSVPSGNDSFVCEHTYAQTSTEPDCYDVTITIGIPSGGPGGAAVSESLFFAIDSVSASFWKAVAAGNLGEALAIMETVAAAGGQLAAKKGVAAVAGMIGAIVKKYPASAQLCTDSASLIQRTFQASGQTATQITIRDAYGASNFFTDKGVQFASTGFHRAVVSAGRVYDALTGAGGMPYDEYIAMLRSWGIVTQVTGL